MKKVAIVLGIGAGIVVCSPAVNADTVFGVYAGVGNWQVGSAGDIGVTDTSPGELGFGEDNNNLFHLALEHPVPLLPNVLVKYTDLSASGNAQLDDPVEFSNVSFMSGETLATDLNLEQVDATLYYEVLDNWLNLDLGVTIRSYRGELTAVSAAQSESVDLDAVVPMAYFMGQFDVPLTGFSFRADANVIGYSGDSISDVSASVAWNTDFLAAFEVGMELGYRRARLDLEDLGDLDTALTFDGPFVAINAHF